MTLLNVTQITIADSILYQIIDNETVLVDLATETFYGLDEVGSRIWQLLKEHGTADSITATLMEEYEIDEVTLHSDIEGLIGKLADMGLIQIG